MPINKDELTKDMIEKAMACKTAEELVALAKSTAQTYCGRCSSEESILRK